MKRILSGMLVVMLVFGMAGGAVADRTFAEIGSSMKEQAVNVFQRYVELYPDGKGAPDEIIDRVYEFQLFYLTGQIIYQLEMNYDPIYSVVFEKSYADSVVLGWEEIVKSLLEKHEDYMNGDMSKDDFAKFVFGLSKAPLAK